MTIDDNIQFGEKGYPKERKKTPLITIRNLVRKFRKEN